MTVSADFSQLDDLAGDFGKLAAALPALATALVTASTFAVEAGAKVRAPVDTGNLRSSIFSTIRTDGAAVIGETGPSANYGDYLERGTSRMAPQPYVFPALDAEAPRFLDGAAQIIGRAP